MKGEVALAPAAPVPSLARRAFVAVTLLVGFYLSAIALSVALFVLPCAYVYFGPVNGFMAIVLLAACWPAAFALLWGAFSARPAPFSPPGVELSPADHDALFATIHDVARRVGTAPPSRVFLVASPVIGVVERGGLFVGVRERTLLLGAPHLTAVTAVQLRAILAHEMGHFAGGDTRLSGLVSYAHQAFQSVYRASVTAPLGEGRGFYRAVAASATHAVGTSFVKLYMRLFLAVTRSTSRQQEIAADALAVRIAGRAAAIGALESAHVVSALYSRYGDDVLRALRAGAAPRDILRGFAAFRARIAERGVEEKVAAAVREEKTDPFDSHPAYSDRVAMMATFPEGPSNPREDSRPARELLGADDATLERWVTDDVLRSVGCSPNLPRRKWASIAKKELPAQIARDATELVVVLSHYFPGARGTAQMFHAIVGALADGSFTYVAHRIEPGLVALLPNVRVHAANALAAHVVTALFEGSLLEGGAAVDLALGDPSIALVLDGERVFAGELATKSITDPVAASEVARWAQRLALPPPADTALAAAPSA